MDGVSTPRPPALGQLRPGQSPGPGRRPCHGRDGAEAQLLALPGIGPWTAAYIRMRALSDPDAFLPADAGVLDALGRLGALPAGTGPAGAAARARAAKTAAGLAEGWRPWRSYAAHHLWAHLEEESQS